jgi:hypothetical protein
MTKEELANHLAKKIYQMSSFNKSELRDTILYELTKVLYADKGRLTKGTLK